MNDEKREQEPGRVKWKALPPLQGGVYVGMVTEVLDNEGIPNVVKTDLEGGGLGRITGTQQIGRPWRIQVPEEFYDRALEIYESLLRQDGESETDKKEQD